MTKIAIVGAGIIGASIAYYLARRGVDVTLIDQAEPATGATAQSWAWLNATHGNRKPYFDLRWLAMRDWRKLQINIGRRLKIDWCGSLVWDLNEDELTTFVHEHAGWGYDIRLVDAAEIKRREPWIKHRPNLAALALEEGALDPVETTSVLVDQAVRLGAKVLPNTGVSGLVTRGGRVLGPQTENGVIEADFTVLAAGTAMTALCAGVDVPLPLIHKPAVMSWFYTQKRLIGHLIVNPDLMIKQLNDHVIVAEETGRHEPDLEHPEREGARVAELIAKGFKHGEKIGLGRSEVGLRPFPADGMPTVGMAPRIDGLYLAVTHSGVTLAPAIGRLATAELLDGMRIDLLSPFRPERFS